MKRKKQISLIFLVLGFIGVIGTMIVTIVQSQMDNIVASVPIAIGCSAIFIAGWIGYLKDDKKE